MADLNLFINLVLKNILMFPLFSVLCGRKVVPELTAVFRFRLCQCFLSLYVN